MAEWDWAKIGGALIAYVGLSWIIIKTLVKRQVDSWEADVKGNADNIEKAKREWKLEMSGIKDAMKVKETEARDGRRDLHNRIDNLDDKVQRDYARQEVISGFRTDLSQIRDQLHQITTMLKNGR